ncbi:MAG: alanine racemase C-terminal domain-containing protein [Anaeroplasma sp.]
MLLIDYYQIRVNIRKYKNAIIVLKNNAYGFGLEKIINICLSENVSRFAVLDLEEAIKIRKINSLCEIILLGIPNHFSNILIKYNITPTALNTNDINYFLQNNIDYYIKVNSNMNRFGFEEFKHNMINKNLKGIYSHFPCYNDNTIEILNKLEKIKNVYHISVNVGGSFLINKTKLDLRIGGAIYENSRKMYARILKINKIKKGEPLGYESSYIASYDHLYAILDIGYFNGIRREFNGYVSFHNKKYKVIGLVCMNHMFTMADKSMKEGNYVEIFGNEIKEDLFLECNHMSKYESYLMIK